MSDSESHAAEEMPKSVESLFHFNHEYRKIICGGGRCGKAIGLGQLGQHLRRSHNVTEKDWRKVTKIARQLGWSGQLWEEVRPEDGLAPQAGIAVRDGFRCKQCRQYMSMVSKDVDVHVHWIHQRQGGKESDAEKVRFQAWSKGFTSGNSDLYWVVDESRTRDAGKYRNEGLALYWRFRQFLDVECGT